MTRHTRRDLLRLACCSAAGASLVGGLSKFGPGERAGARHNGLQSAGVHLHVWRK